MSHKGRIVVAMSGGVDSSAAAAVLHRSGYDVIGVTLKLYDASGTSASIGGRCCSPRDIADARRVAEHLGFPHYVLDEVDIFKGAVIDDFVAEYRAGRTPNPCVRCNERIKFGPLLDFAHSVGAKSLATGHYARLKDGPSGLRLLRSVDRDKDQSYFLFGVKRSILQNVMFPVGDLPKSEVRKLAHEAGLPNADKPDSNQICFIPDGDHKAFVEDRGGAGNSGVVLSETGAVLGEHAGTHHFTIGQRKSVPGVDGKRRFVLHIDPESGNVYTGPRESLGRSEITVETVRWMDGVAEADTRCDVQIRHRGQALPARIFPSEDDAGSVRVVFEQPAEGAAPGQAAVFFKDDEVIGGGWIQGRATNDFRAEEQELHSIRLGNQNRSPDRPA